MNVHVCVYIVRVFMDMFLYERVSCVCLCLSDEPVLFCIYVWTIVVIVYMSGWPLREDKLWTFWIELKSGLVVLAWSQCICISTWNSFHEAVAFFCCSLRYQSAQWLFTSHSEDAMPQHLQGGIELLGDCSHRIFFVCFEDINERKHKYFF